MKVTDEDRALLDAIEALEVHDDEAALMACELIATHRQSAERRALDRAAEVATSIGEQYGEDETGWFECSETIATAIRALGDE